MREEDEQGRDGARPRGSGPALQLLRGGAAPLVVYGAPQRRRRTRLPLELTPLAAAVPVVRYRWDPDTAILVAQLAGDPDDPPARGPSGAVELEGLDGSWVTLECSGGVVCGLEVAVWPEARVRRTLALPPMPDGATALGVPALAPGAWRARPDGVGGLADVEVDTVLALEVDAGRRTYHLRVGPVREVRAVWVGRDMLVDVDAAGDLAGVWLSGVPPLPPPH